MYDQQLADLQAIIKRQEEEIDKLRMDIAILRGMTRQAQAALRAVDAWFERESDE